MDQTRHLGHISRIAAVSTAVLAFLVSGSPAFATDSTGQEDSPDTDVRTADTSTLKTWWQSNGVKDSSGPIQDRAVRESPFYTTQVSTAADSDTNPSGDRYDSFTYMSIPRDGSPKQGYTDQDGAEFASESGQSMSWSTFEYSKDSWVYIHLTDGTRTISSAADVVIRPSKDHFPIHVINRDTVAIRVPYSPHGQRFSVEFAPEQMNVYNTMQGVSGSLTTHASSQSRLIDTEPRHAMMVFAQPLLTGSSAKRFIPTSASGTVYYPAEGKVDDLGAVKADVIYFRPGIYWMTGSSHAQLSARVRWVYLAPGAYVKGALQFMDGAQSLYKVTGYGILSGEQYPYESDTSNGYRHIAAGKSDCYASCVMMMRFSSSDQQQHLDLQGVTVANPPYHSFVVYGNEDTFSMTVKDYQQVGAWYWQTDGIEPYTGSTVEDTFFHSNDDVLKLYHSNVSIDNTVVWKDENGPVIQWGWSPRQVSDVSVSNTDVIHNRMYWKDEKYNTCVINSSSSYLDMGATNTADTTKTYKNLTISDTNVEGMVNCALRIYALQNMENIKIDGLHIYAWDQLDVASQYSRFSAFSDRDGKKVSIGKASDGKGLLLRNYTVGSTSILKAGDNWASTGWEAQHDGDLWDGLQDATADGQPQGPAPASISPGISDHETSPNRSITVSGSTSGQRVTVSVNNTSVADEAVREGKYRISIPLPDLSNSVRISFIAESGAMAVQRYTVYSYGTKIGFLQDPKGDDNGPGSYVYPSDGAFSKGSFDLTGMDVYTDGPTVRFVTSLAGPISNPWGGHGMSTQRLNIYLKKPQGNQKAVTTALLPGTNTFAKGAWYRAIVADGRNDGSRYSTGVYSPSLKKVSAADLMVLSEGKIIVSVPKTALRPLDPDDSSYQVSMFSSSEDTEGVGNVRPVFGSDCWNGKDGCPGYVHQFRFGGGKGHVLDHSPYDSDTTDTNAIDVISGTTRQTEALSLSHHQAVVPYVTLTPVPHDSSQTNPSGHHEQTTKSDTRSFAQNNPNRRSLSARKTMRREHLLSRTGLTVIGTTAAAILLLTGVTISWIALSHQHDR